MALRRHLGGTTRSPHDLVIDAEKIHFWERGAGDLALALALALVLSASTALERGPGEARAQLCELHGRIRPPDCCPKEPQVTQTAPHARRPKPATQTPKATSQGSTAKPG